MDMVDQLSESPTPCVTLQAGGAGGCGKGGEGGAARRWRPWARTRRRRLRARRARAAEGVRRRPLPGVKVVYKIVAMMQRWKELLKEGDRGQVDKWKEVILVNLARLRQQCDPPEDI
uniref:Uncharacterized protein n=1 Tax=Oryza glumipatula TaxID=40148 RepID=A0A0D9YM70_9ORYZ